MFSLLSLRCFIVTVEERNFTRAAKRLYISQQALSHHISRLEDHFGVKLFDRTPPVSLTDAGNSLYKYAKFIFDSLGDCTKEINDIKDFHQGELSIAIPVTRGSLMLPPLLGSFHQQFPQIHITLEEGDTDLLLESILNATVDLCIGYVPKNTEKLAVTPLYHEKFAVLVPKQLQSKVKISKTSSQTKVFPIECFSDLPFITQALDTKNGMVFQELCSGANITPNILLSTQNLITLILLGMEGLGACVIPLSFLIHKPAASKNALLFNPDTMNSMSVYLLDTNNIASETLIGIYRRKDRSLTRAAKEFISFSQNLFGE